MKKKCLAVGIILLFIGVAVAPSINATDIRTIFENNNKAALSTFESNVVKRTDSIKHPLFFLFVYSIYASRFIRGSVLTLISWKEYPPDLPPTLIHPILALRGAWLIVTAMFWYYFWNHLSESRGWNWPPLCVFISPNYLENQS